jgi:MOSC domain-containing protein YiiM
MYYNDSQIYSDNKAAWGVSSRPLAICEDVNVMGEIISIVYQPLDQEYGDRLGDYLRKPLHEAKLIADHGIEGDRKAGHNKKRQLNIVSYEWLEELRPLGYRTEPGEFGEQIIVKGLRLDGMEAGDRLHLGAAALVELTVKRTGCMRLEAAQGLSNNAFGNLVGWMARVINSGTIRVGDNVEMQSR